MTLRCWISPDAFSGMSPEFTAGGGLAFWDSKTVAVILAANYASYSGSVSTFYASTGLRAYPTNGTVRPYFEGGVGFFHQQAHITRNGIGIHAEVGAQASIAFACAQYVVGFTSGTATSYLSLRAGLAVEVSG